MTAFTNLVTITRPNDTSAYAANDVIGASTGATAAVQVSIARGAMAARIRSTLTVISAAAVISGESSYNLHFYTENPASALGDNAAWDLGAGDRGVYVGSLALGTPADIGSSLVIATDSFDRFVWLPTGNLWVYLVTVGSNTPTASRVYSVRLSGELFPHLTTEVLT